jgi:basic membrane protein A
LIGQSCGLIITVGFTMGDATYAAAQAHPDLKFAIVDQTFETSLPNLSSVVFDVGQAAFLGGYAAAALDPNGAVGMSGGMKIAPVTLYLDGVADGVAYYNDINSTDVRVLGWNVDSQEGTFVGSFTDQAQAQSIAQAFLSQGATVLMGGGGLLVPATAQTLQKNGSGAMLWADVDGCATAPEYCDVIIGSMLKGVGPSVDRIAQSFAKGESLPSTYVGTLENGGVGFVLNSAFPGKLPSGLQSDIDAVAKGIEDGSIAVNSPSTPK